MLNKIKYFISLLKEWIDINISLKSIAYLITFLYLLYIIYICFCAEPNRFLVGNVGIKLDSIDFGGLGSLLAGIFSPLAFLWLLLTFKQTDKNLHIAQKQLKLLEEKEENRRKLIKPIFSEISSKVFPSFPFPNDWYSYEIKIKIIGELHRIIPIIKSDPSIFRVEKKVLSHFPKSEIDGFPFNKSFKDQELDFIFQICCGKLSGNEIFEIELHYLDIDGNDQTTIIYVKYIQITEEIDGVNQHLLNHSRNIEVSFNKNDLI